MEKESKICLLEVLAQLYLRPWVWHTRSVHVHHCTIGILKLLHLPSGNVHNRIEIHCYLEHFLDSKLNKITFKGHS